MGQIGFQSGIHFSFSVINHDRCCNSGLSNLSLHINNDIRLSLLNSDLILESHVGCSKSIFESLRQISLTQLERLNSRIALNQKNILEFVLHIHSYTSQVSEEHTSCKLTRLIIHWIDCESNARALVVISISLIESDQISLVQLVLELSSEINHQSIFWSSFDCAPVGWMCIRKLQSLHRCRILNEFVHEAQVMITWCIYLVTYLLCDRRVVKPVSIDGYRTEREDNESNNNHHH